MKFNSLSEMEAAIPRCTKCSRLITYTREVAEKKVKRYRDEPYWGKPVPGFGDHNARLLIIGLAPGAHGANRTGRMFTGDDSGHWLYKALYETGFASQPQSESRDDGMQLRDAYISAIVRCAPPQNKPTAEERRNCSFYLEEELRIMRRQLKVVICLGHMAFGQYCRIEKLHGLEFGHLYTYTLKDKATLICSYHPSRQNTNTGRLKWEPWLAVFKTARGLLQ